MKEAWSNVESLLMEMRPLLLESGVPEHQVRMPVGREPEKIKLPQYVEAFDWLHRIYTGPDWECVVKAKSLRPQEQWDSYKAYGFTGLQEQLILESAQVKLRKAWKFQRPRFFGKVFKPDEEETTEQDADCENPESECVRPEEAGSDEHHRGRG